MKNLRWGLIGFGDAGENFYKDLKFRKNSELKNICSKSRFHELKKNFLDVDISDNYDVSLERNNIDIVYISLINSLHYKYLKKAIKSNKHVLVEKPACMNFDEIKDIKKNIHSFNLIQKINLNYMFWTKNLLNYYLGILPSLKVIKSLVESLILE